MLAALMPADMLAMGFGCGGCHLICLSLLGGALTVAGFLPEVGMHLWQGRLTGPYHPLTCARTASAWGSQNVISMARYSSMAIDNSAVACSRWPVVA
jgi:hypothetical protein